ncbi:MAG: Rpn family recombination-promoting nuclease/putative transposase [Candidatus Competibacteraceae bacterium]|nr:Rpn family recombination-promoting nuclease/putative transposase [Candidatus Competibacteraceae bacterium]
MRRLITFDWAIKRLLRSKANFDVLEGFLSELLKDDIQIVEVLESESNKDRTADKFNRVDLKVRNSRQQIILMEIQYDREYDYLQRMFYGAAKAVTEHLAEGQPYADIVKVISVNILYFDLGQGEDYVYHGQTVFTGIHKHDQLQLNEKQKELFQQTTVSALYPEYYLIKINQFNDVAKDPLDEWIYFLKHEEIKEHFTARGLQAAREKLDILKLSPEERVAYERYADDLHYQASMFMSSYGDGFHEGRKEGLQEGMEQGRHAEKLAIARSLIGILSVEVIAEKTGLSREAIEQLSGE